MGLGNPFDIRSRLDEIITHMTGRIVAVTLENRGCTSLRGFREGTRPAFITAKARDALEIDPGRKNVRAGRACQGLYGRACGQKRGNAPEAAPGISPGKKVAAGGGREGTGH